MKFSGKDFLSKYKQIRRKLRIYSHCYSHIYSVNESFFCAVGAKKISGNINGALLGLRQFPIPESPLKMMTSAFYFTLKAFLVFEIFKFLFWPFG